MKRVDSPVASSMYTRIRPRRPLNINLPMIITIIRRYSSSFDQRSEEISLDRPRTLYLSIGRREVSAMLQDKRTLDESLHLHP